MTFSRHSLRRVIGDMVHRNSSKNDTINSSTIDHRKSSSQLQTKSDRNSLISNSSLSLPQTSYERLHKSEKEVCKSLNYLDQVLTHNKYEILAHIITSLIENIFDIDNVLKGIFEHKSESFRMNLLSDVYSLLADLIEWSDKLLLSINNGTKIDIHIDNHYKKIVRDLIQAVKKCISYSCETLSFQSFETRSDSFQSFQSTNSSVDDLAPALPPKRDKRSLNNTSTTVISNRAGNNENPNSFVFSSSSDQIQYDKDNDERIQSIVDDINNIVEKYTRELDDALRTKTAAFRSPSFDYLSDQKRSSVVNFPNDGNDTTDSLYETNVSKLTKSTITKTTVYNGQEQTDKKESCQIYNEIDCSIHSTKGNFQSQTLTLINRTKTNDDNDSEQKKTVVATRLQHFNNSDDDNKMNDLPPLPPKQKTAKAYMSLFDRYDQNEAQLFVQDKCFIPTPKHGFEDLFEHIHQHFQQMQVLSDSDESLRLKEAFVKQMNKSNQSYKCKENIDDSNPYDNTSTTDNETDIFLEDASHSLVFNLDEDPSLRGGSIDALIIRATSSEKKDFLYQEAFLTTYRTFVCPKDLIDKLIQRYTYFFRYEMKKKMARYAFSLLIRVIDEIDNELNVDLMKCLSQFVTDLIRHGELQLGKLLRRKSHERFNKSHLQPQSDIAFIKNSISSKRPTLLDFNAVDISEQLTIIDSELFLKIQLSEILYMSIEKGEEYSPNLAAFTEHFNNISYWVRTRILEQNSQRQREIYFEKFLKILKHLRRLNNFNSYLAILSALDCGALKRLNWSKSIIDAISEHTGLIDSTGSFKNYREALNATVGQPCIPYIGLILSDLTFVHIGNSDYLQDGRMINFWKRWQQFTILHKLRYCRKWEHKFTRNDRILYFFNNFDDYMNEEAQWIQSEKIKPRQKANPYA